jgi:hypothetical protein
MLHACLIACLQDSVIKVEQVHEPEWAEVVVLDVAELERAALRDMVGGWVGGWACSQLISLVLKGGDRTAAVHQGTGNLSSPGVGAKDTSTKQ